MKRYIALLAALSIALAIGSCNDESDLSKTSSADSTNVEVQKAPHPDPRTGLQIEALVEQERSRTDWWQGAAMILAIATVVFFLGGIIIGSATRNETEQ